jgi:rod shape-determining protein MreD
VAGILFDLVLRSPFGLSALTYCITGYIVGSFRGSVLRSSWWIPVAAAVPASMFGVALFALLGTVLGQESYVSSHLFAIMGVVAVVNALLIVPAVRVMRWALAVDTRPRLGPARA